ncbi:MAG: flagellar biosynthesis anti-sigma factor FlgM [Terriglobales bacterium]
MRIGLNAPDQQQSIAAEQTKSSSPVTSQSDSMSVGDKSGLSQDTVTLSALSTQALSQPEVRQNLVDSLKQSISSGQYNLDPRQIADSILS